MFTGGGSWTVRQVLTSRRPYISERERPLAGIVISTMLRPPGLPGHQGWKTTSGGIGAATFLRPGSC